MSARTNLLLATTVAVASIATAGVASAASIESSGFGKDGQKTDVTINATNPVYCEIGAEANKDIEFRKNDNDDYQDVVEVKHGCNTSYELVIVSGEAFKRDSGTGDDGTDGNNDVDRIPWNFTSNELNISDKEFGENFSSEQTILTRSTQEAVAGDSITDEISLDLETNNDVATRAVASGDYSATVEFAVRPN
jgi:hypothetical protein